MAHAQVRYDLGALGSFVQRFADTAEGGGILLDGHIAVLPLLRIGAYATGEVSDRLTLGATAPGQVTGSSPIRELLGGGVRVKLVPPWPRGVWRAWLAFGFGYVGVIADDAGGGFFEVPIAIGASYRIRKPIVFLMELGARLGFAQWGSYYAIGATAPDQASGNDVVAITLSLGIGIDR